MSQKVEWVGIVCERSVDFEDHLDDNGCFKDDPSVKIVRVPCSGIIQPAMMEAALKGGADGTFAVGCRMGDCHYREGNKFLRERLQGKRMPKLKPTTDKSRVEAYWLSALEYDLLRDFIEDFKNRVNPPAHCDSHGQTSEDAA